LHSMVPMCSTTCWAWPAPIVEGPQRRRIPQDRYKDACDRGKDVAAAHKDTFVVYHRDLPSAFLTATATILSGWRCRRCRMTCKPSKSGEMKQVPPPNRWVTSQPVMTPSSSPITLRPDMRIDEVIRILLRSNAVCVGDAPDGVFFVKVAQNDDTQDPGLACINLADLLEAPRQLPLDCLLGLGNKEECDLYSSAPEPYVGKSVQTELYGRLPWLLGLLVFLSVSSAILEFFDVLLQKHLIIAFYLTALVGCGGNAGSQAASLVLQALATGELVPTFGDLWRVLRKEVLVAPGIAATLSLGIAGRILLFGGSAVDALAIALAMAVTVSGLQNAAALNGTDVLLQKWDEASRRWIVSMPDGTVKSIRPQNLDPLYASQFTARAPDAADHCDADGERSYLDREELKTLARTMLESTAEPGGQASATDEVLEALSESDLLELIDGLSRDHLRTGDPSCTQENPEAPEMRTAVRPADTARKLVELEQEEARLKSLAEAQAKKAEEIEAREAALRQAESELERKRCERSEQPEVLDE